MVGYGALYGEQMYKVVSSRLTMDEKLRRALEYQHSGIWPRKLTASAIEGLPRYVHKYISNGKHVGYRVSLPNGV